MAQSEGKNFSDLQEIRNDNLHPERASSSQFYACAGYRN